MSEVKRTLEVQTVTDAADKIVRWRFAAADLRARTMNYGADALREAADECERLGKERSDFMRIAVQERQRKEKLEAALRFLAERLRDISRPDYVIKNDVVWAYQILGERMNMARDGLTAVRVVLGEEP